MKILVTAGKGQVGDSLTKQLGARSDVQLLSVDHDQLDITNREHVFSIVNQFRPDFIINAAAYTAVDKAEQEKERAYAVNRDGPAFLADAACSVNAVILHISTDYVFSGNTAGKYTETDLTDPQSIYGASKLAGELAVAENCSKHIILRTAWVFGESGNNFVKTMIRLAREKDSLGIVGDQFGGPTYSGDIAAALIRIADEINRRKSKFSGYGVYHFSGQPYVSWFEFANYIFKRALEHNIISKIPHVDCLSTSEYPTPARRPENSKLDTVKIEETFSISASDWQKALKNIQQYSE